MIEKQRRHNFSMLELLVVLAILGVVAALTIPLFSNTENDAKISVAHHEMELIRSAFGKMSQDCPFFCENIDTYPSCSLLAAIGKCGLWGLFQRHHPNETLTMEFPVFDFDTAFGWRGPYLRAEDMIQIDNSADLTENAGQPESNNGLAVPILRDPWGGYYRVLIPGPNHSGDGRNLNEYLRLKHLTLVCTGPDRILNTTPFSFWTPADAGYERTKADDLKAQGDDLVLRLLPFDGRGQN